MFLKFFFLLLAIIPANSVFAGVSVTDDFGNKVVLKAPAKRIIALYGAFNEILFAMDLGDTIVARTSGDDYPAQIIKLPSIGTHMRPNPELIVALNPDLVLQMAGRPQAESALEPIKERGIPTAMFTVTSFNDLYALINKIGILTGEPERADKLINSMASRLDKVNERFSTVKDKPRVFFEIRYPNLLAAGQGSIVSDIIDKAGGVNCVQNSKKIVRMGEEEVFRLDPENYVYQSGRMNQSPVVPADRDHFKMIKAVRLGKVLKVDESVFSRPGPRNVDAVETLADFLYSKN
ncbi:iron complex transport system substrate-binding protein [Desulfovibrio gilichinskyi]|uniref:Iron complex transport system substrate-binding protein n=1 Tax=Desulfovibrio gilichinskyi TaxID=1519643 RepID=A0A1X7F0D2_9BACT|nr:iron complex transport system substrate-binding protein [Desulfovibrio gilichinskyi]